MGTISLQNPTIGLPDTTEDVKVQNNFTTLQTVINGNIDDTNLKSPNNAARRLLMTQVVYLGGGQTYTSGAYAWFSSTAGSQPLYSGASAGSVGPQLWFPDSS
jgi:hypothetical protein